MPSLGPVLDLAYAFVMSLTTAVVPLFGTGAGAAAVVLTTIGVRLVHLPLTLRQIRGERDRQRLAPRLAQLRERHGDDAMALARESAALMRAEGASPLGGCLPPLVQAPFFVVLYALFTTSTVDGGENALLESELLGVPLREQWLTGTVTGGHDLVFYGLLAAIAAIAAWTSRRMRAARPVEPTGGVVSNPGTAGAAAVGALSRVLPLLPFVTVVVAATAPLAAGLYLLTTTAWTAAENAILRRPRVAL